MVRRGPRAQSSRRNPWQIWRGRAISTCLGAALLAVACSGRTTPAASSPATTPSTPLETPANVAGTWSGTIESSGFVSRAITMLAFQGGTCVDGAWKTEPAEWSGAISGYANATSFSGSMTVQGSDNSSKCSGVATVSGTVGADTIRWTGSDFTGACPGWLPQSLTIVLRRP